jgi:hypothetical protein
MLVAETLSILIAALEKSSEAVGKLKGHIELLEEKIQRLDNKLDVNANREENFLSDIRKELDELSDAVRTMATLLDASPFKDLKKSKDESDKLFEGLIRVAMVKLDKLVEWSEEHKGTYRANIAEFIEVTKKTDNLMVALNELKAVAIEKRKGNLLFWGVVVTAVLGLVGNIVQGYLKYLGS